VRPERILFVRHGESEGNVDETLFEKKPDHLMELTPRGVEQARAAGGRVREIVAGGAVRAYVSPYLRTRQTLRSLGIADLVDRVSEEPRLREQEWGNLWDRTSIHAQKAVRNEFGHFFYRFMHGESGADVYDRVSSFLETLHRDFERPSFPSNVLVVTHGMTLRLFLMRWFHWSVEYFESLDNPGFCEVKVLTRSPAGWTLDAPLAQWKPCELTRTTTLDPA
jgi:broad specificity phosphatase PhoE